MGGEKSTVRKSRDDGGEEEGEKERTLLGRQQRKNREKWLGGRGVEQ